MKVLRRCPLAIAQRLVHCAIALSTAVLDRVTKTMSVAPLLMNNLDNSKQKTSNLLSPAPPPYSWSLLGKSEGPAPPPSSKISWSFDLAWSPWDRSYVHVNYIDRTLTRNQQSSKDLDLILKSQQCPHEGTARVRVSFWGKSADFSFLNKTRMV